MRKAREGSYHSVGLEGDKQKEWVLIDFGSIVVHVFLNDIREYYRIERLFKDCKKYSFESEQIQKGDEESIVAY